MIEFDDVSFSFGEEAVLEHVSFKMEKGQFIGILGPNGGGKTTFLKLALGLLKQTSGTVKVTADNISYLAQTTSISSPTFPCTVKEAISVGLVNLKPRLSHKEEMKRIDEVLEKMGLYELRNRLVNELSGGQAQRVKLAKALVRNPSLIILDEPDVGMDEESHEAMMETIDKLHKEGTSILFVSHHPHDLEKADAIYFFEDGNILPYEEELKRGHHHVDL